MPFVKKIEVENGILGLWELTDTVDSLIEIFNFSDPETKEFEKFTFEKRKIEYLATRLLLQTLLGVKTEITYKINGKPVLINTEFNVSISHSSEFVIVFISKKTIGIDIENAHRQIDKVAKRFLHRKEMEWIEKTTNQQFLKILYWCAKEAIYKCAAQTGIQFDSQIFIEPFKFEKTGTFTGKLTTPLENKNFEMQYFSFQNNVVVYCVEVTKNK